MYRSFAATAATDPTPIRSPEGLKTFLCPLRNMFCGAASVSPEMAISEVKQLPDILQGYPDVYKLEENKHGRDRELPEDAPAAVVAAYQYFGLCGLACWVVEVAIWEELRRQNVSVEMIAVRPFAKLLMFVEKTIRIENHCVLKFSMPCGIFVADFTLGQFGHDPEDWFLDWDEYVRKYTLPATVKFPRTHRLLEQREIDAMEYRAYKTRGGYWAEVKDWVSERWKEFETMSEEQQRLRAVRDCLRFEN